MKRVNGRIIRGKKCLRCNGAKCPGCGWTGLRIEVDEPANQSKPKIKVGRFDLADRVLMRWQLDTPADCEEPVREYKLEGIKGAFDLAWPSVKLLCEIHGGTRSQRGKSRSHAGGRLTKDAEKARLAWFMDWNLLTFTDEDLRVGEGRVIETLVNAYRKLKRENACDSRARISDDI